MPDSSAPQLRSQRSPDPELAGPRRGLSLLTRLLLGYLLLLLAFGSVLIVVLLGMRMTQASLAMLSTGYLPLAREIGAAQASPLGLELEPGKTAQEVYENRRPESRFILLKERQLQSALELAEAMAAAEGSPADSAVAESVATQIAAVLETLARYKALHGELVAAVEADDSSADGLVPQLVGLDEQIQVEVRNLTGRINRRIGRVVDETDDSQRDARFASAALSFLAFGVGVLVVIATGIMLRPVRQLIVGADRIREGHFDERVPVRTGDEVGRLAEAFNAMAASVEERERILEQRSDELEAALSDLRASQAALIRSERLATIGQMAAQIAHEVRNPLNALGLNADLLAEELQAGTLDEAAEIISDIKGEVARLTDVTEAYLALGRLPPLRLEPCPVGTLVEELVRFQFEELGQAGVEVRLELPPDLPEVHADSSQLRQALLNIVRNAADALRSEGGGCLRVSAREDGQGVQLEVRDDGPGMDAEHVSRIFDPFFSTKETGSGLGLPITQQVITEHGGRIACTSSPGDGTAFRIWLPRSSEGVDRSS